MNKVIGIDLGTTNSAVAYMTDEGPRLIPTAVGENLTPSVVGLDDDGKLPRRPSRPGISGHLSWPLRIAFSSGRWGSICPSSCLAENSRPRNCRAWCCARSRRTPRHFSASRSKHRPSSRKRRPISTISNAEATINAGRIAGLKVERIFNEPTAAALAYGFHEQREDKMLLIVDLGGGTFDVSIVEIFDGTLEVRASSGESLLGGEDFTRTLAARVLEGQGFPFERTEMEAPLMVARMLQQCEAAKCRLTKQDNATLRLPDRKGEFPVNAPELTVSRQQFEELDPAHSGQDRAALFAGCWATPSCAEKIFTKCCWSAGPRA